MTLFPIQNLHWPCLGVPDGSFIRGGKIDRDRITLASGDSLHLGGYMNCFDAGQWRRCTSLRYVAVQVHGSGQFRISCRAHDHATSYDVVTTDRHTDEVLWIDLPQSGQLSLTLIAVDDAEITDVRWLTDRPPNPIRPVICVTHYRQEAAVAQNMEALAELAVPRIVIDNSRTLPNLEGVTIFPNRNLGGSGGFARAIIEAKNMDATHAIFMDDDATCSPEAIKRMLSLLRYANNRNTAVVGAMVSDLRPDEIWENGATFNKRCRPRSHRLRLSNFGAVYGMLGRQSAAKPANYYGGWWLFGFPLSAVTTLPFPYFVRGDDISFSLSNPFAFETIAGVFAVQPDFVAKETAFSLYLDLRNHLHQHLVHDAIAIGRLQIATIAIGFVAKSIFRMHYACATAQIWAWQDVMKGAAFFADIDNTMRRREQITAIDTTGRFRTTTAENNEPQTNPKHRRILSILTLNGLLLPAFRYFGRRALVATQNRSALWPYAMAQSAEVFAPNGETSFVVRHSKWTALKVGVRLAMTTLRWLFGFNSVRNDHLDGYRRYTTGDYWDREFAKGNQTHPTEPTGQ